MFQTAKTTTIFKALTLSRMYKTPYLPQGSFFSSNLEMFASQTKIRQLQQVGLVILKHSLKIFVRTLSQLKN